MLLLAIPTLASACPVCFGDPNSAMVKGTNNGIFFLLGVIGFVQVGLGAMFVAFWRRARALRARRDSLRLINGGLFRCESFSTSGCPSTPPRTARRSTT